MLGTLLGEPPRGELPESLRAVTVARAGAPEAQGIKKVSYTHDAMIDQLVQNPWISQGDLAKMFGYTESWISLVIASDAFQARLAQRKDELVDPQIKATIEERFKAITLQSLDKLRKKLEADASSISADTLLRAAEMGAKVLGYGVAKGVGLQVQNNFVVHVPPKAASASEWSKQHSPRQAVVLDATQELPPGDGAARREALTDVSLLEEGLRPAGSL